MTSHAATFPTKKLRVALPSGMVMTWEPSDPAVVNIFGPHGKNLIVTPAGGNEPNPLLQALERIDRLETLLAQCFVSMEEASLTLREIFDADT